MRFEIKKLSRFNEPRETQEEKDTMSDCIRDLDFGPATVPSRIKKRKRTPGVI